MVVACGSTQEASKESGPARSDSAGIEIVVTPAVLPSNLEYWEVEDTAFVVIGRNGQGPAHQFAGIGRAVLLPNGSVILSEGPVPGDRGNVYFRFDSNGTFEHSFGRTGEGPGDFRHGTRPFASGDSVWVYDRMLLRATVFAQSGRIGRVVGINTTPVASPLARMPNGTWFFSDVARPSHGQSAWRDTAVVTRIDGGGNAVPVLKALGAEFTASGSPLPFGRAFAVVGDDSGFYGGSTDRYEIRRYDIDGRLRRIIRRELPPRAVTEADRRKYVQRIGGNPGEFSPSLPAFGGLEVDGEGNLWVQEYVPDLPDTAALRYVVFGSDGRVRALASLPRIGMLGGIGRDRVLFVSGAEAKVYRIRKR